ncbi:MAG: D-alanyl-D-alanine carboxypeptidase [Clostridia bacterium]|nr:D-alanyl-D-alanine carboxypeptidase [Clostridia bacterium]
MKRVISLIVCLLLLTQNALASKSAVLIEAGTGQVLNEQNAHDRLPPASVTKVMTMLLIMEAIDSGKIGMDDLVTCSEYAATMGGSQVYLEAGEQMPVSEMLKAIAVASANDACVAMAEHLCGTEEAFVKQMNERAAALGMKNTTFCNTNGLPDPNHLTTAYDIALMSKELLKHEKILPYLGIWTDSLRNGAFGLANTNKLIRFYKGANGIKTGSTAEAGFCLSASAIRNGMQLIAVVLGAPTSKERFAEATELLDYGFANFEIADGVDTTQVLANVPVLKGVSAEVALLPQTSFSPLLPKGKKDAVTQVTEIPKSVLAPIEAGQELGQVRFLLDDQEIGCVPLVAAETVQKLGMGESFLRICRAWVVAKQEK